MTPRSSLLVVATLSLAVAACSTPLPQRVSESADGAGRIVLSPLNVSVRAPAELDGQMDVVWHGLLDYFQTYDRRVALLSPISAERLWLEASANLEMSDRTAALRTASQRYARGLAKHRDFDVLVVPSLVLRPAQMHGRQATWDGVHRDVPGGTGVLESGLADAQLPANTATVIGLRGKVAAASLHVALYRPDGSLIREGLGGLDVIQQATRDASGRWSFEVRPEPFADVAHLREGVELAFERPSKLLALR